MGAESAVKVAGKEPGDKLVLLLIAGSGMLAQFLSLVAGIIVARMVGVEGRGQVVMVGVLAQMASQLTLGGSLPNAISKELATHGLRARDGLRGLVGRWVLWGCLAATAAGIAMLLNEGPGITPEVVALAIGTGLMALNGMTARILVSSMLGEGADGLAIALTGLLPQLAAALVLGGALALGVDWGPVEIVAVMLFAQSLVLAFRFRALAPSRGRDVQPLDRSELARLARRTHIGSVGPLDGLSLDRALVGALVGSVGLGLYSAAVALGSLATMLGGIVAMVALPRIAAAQAAGGTEERSVVRRWLVLAAILMVGSAAVFMAANPFAIPILFGEEFRGAIACGYWCVAASAFLAFRRVLIAVLQGRGRGGFASWAELALTPFVVLAALLGNLFDDVEYVGMGMLGVGIASCVILGVAVRRLTPAPALARAAAPTGDATG
ncbi:lipopolysaccharide biosynthesis protein [Nocardioides sp. AE5]|uniref:lipopolysaccharide biosynthesis protein n=1 Tax=Nocardioides sp. AE5 TaxID=2962573 RepID=UPI002881151F|nr:lipopolysaccharide biosynthesis protein [Nocardioides sp. AE5]MDT0202572.1 lipopolysaccharide biosynthesis protein [Nocardioides sp. AE5]